MNVLILGSGGRECAFSWKLSQSPKLSQLFIAPGNAGTSAYGQNVDLKETDFEAIKTFVIQNDIKMVVVGPEAPLVEGIHDFFAEEEDLKNITVIGPKKAGAELEGSKDFAKEFMAKHHIPTARYKTFNAENLEEGYTFLESLKAPYVLKADGLAAGKGVLILDNLDTAKTELKTMIADAKFGEASAKVVIEEFLDGIELSCFALTDGSDYVLLPNAKDYKRIGEGDTGLNTGGMGAISPVPFASEEFMAKIESKVVRPTIEGLKKDQLDYQGFVFFGLIKVGEEPFVIEYNVRMGDPETEVVLPRIESDLLELFEAVGNKNLASKEIQITDKSATTVMLVSGGYPEAYEKGKEMKGLNEVENSILFHAGTKEDNGKVVTSGGRVMAITSYGENFREALKQSYTNAEKVDFDGVYYRKDLGFDL
ncbi:MAG: phosphoribosylamine--glycine ligase [Flavobacteriales bacterium]|jgi:phosphoribosylamine--glycine ligase|nr:phosphoribosylamine--glycine ligase [Flavobacteriales bacterium]